MSITEIVRQGDGWIVTCRACPNFPVVHTVALEKANRRQLRHLADHMTALAEEIVRAAR